MKKTLFTLIGLMMLPLVANAAVEHLNLPVCDLAVFPFNPDSPAVYGEAGTALINKLGETVCKNRTTYGQSYNQPPKVSENPLKAGADGQNTPKASHLHSYVNNSLEDNYYYRSFIDKFEIDLESDTLSKVDLNTVECALPVPNSYTGNADDLLDCNGQVNDLYGGTKVSFNKTTGVILWRFGINDLTKRPGRWGNNAGLSSILSSYFNTSIDLTNYNDLYRKFDPRVYLTTKNNSDEIWSATSTSRILIRNYAISKSSINSTPPNYGNLIELCDTIGDYTKWCPLPTPAGQGFETVQLGDSGQQQWFWLPIGSDVSVWRKPATPPNRACADLQWDGAFEKNGSTSPDLINQNALLADESAVMKFETIYESGTGEKRPLEYHWVSFFGDQNRPAWFTNEDTLFVYGITSGLKPFFESSLPSRMLQVAHAAVQPANNGSSASVNPGSYSQTTPVVTQAALIKIGNFKDEISSVMFENPLIDNDNQIFYNGSSEGVTVGVQAYYADGKNVSGDGPMVSTSSGQKQKAQKCHLELVIQPPPVTCVKLDISPSSLLPNTPVTFTVTPHFNPGNKTIPLNYKWSADPITLGADFLNNGGFKDSASSSGLANNPFTEITDNKTYYTGSPGNAVINVKAEGKDGTAYPLCKNSLSIPPAGIICKQLKAIFMNEGTSVTKEDMVSGKTYTISIDKPNSLKSDNSPISKYSIAVFNENGPGTLVPSADNAASCSSITVLPVTNPGPVPKAIGTVPSTSVDCKYVYTPKAGDKITLLADPHDGVAACKIEQIIPTIPGGKICQNLNLTTSPILSGNEIGQGQLVAFTANPRDTENNLLEPVVYTETGSGHFILTTNTLIAYCPEPPDSGTFEAVSLCKYSYQAPTDGSGASVSIKVKQDDGVADCIENFIVQPTTTEEICLALNLRVNGQYSLNPLIEPGQSYALQANPMTTQGNQISMVEWSENSDGKLIGDPGNISVCPASIDNGSAVTLSVCRYIFASSPSATNVSFAVRAVPDDNVANCRAEAQNYIPPVVPPYCLYLDLDYTPEPFNPLTTSQMNATVVMSDGSKYNDYVRFNSTNSTGNFSGGTGGTSGGGTSDFRTQTNASNNTEQVTYTDGNEDSGINVFLSDTSIHMSAACQRQLRPQPTVQPPVCEEPPHIVKKGDREYCAEDGDSASYCWGIDGAGNPIFNNGQTTATGNCVTLDSDYANFDLRVEDCNPEFRDYCFDTLEKEDTPKIEKRISKNSPIHYGTRINYSTTGSQNQQVDYKIDFTPANYQEGNYMLVKIYDPAFTGTLQGYKTTSDGESKTAGGTIDFNDVENSISIDGYEACSSSASRIDKCYQLNKSQGYLEIRGITSDDLISIKYRGRLISGLTLEDCQEGRFCNEQFINQSYVTDMQFCREETDSEGNTTVVCEDVPKPSNPRCEYFYNEKGEKVLVSGNEQDCDMPTYTIASNNTIAELVCQYFLTRASGDVFLEDNLQYGIDVSKCYPFKNISSTVVKPTKPIDMNTPSTGTSAQIVSINHEICSAGQNNFAGLPADQKAALKNLFGSDISTLSSQICEVGLVPGSDWNKSSIDMAISQNIGKLTRWSSDINPSQTIDGVGQITEQGKVYYYKGNGNRETVTINSLAIPEGSGALTIIVEDADLQINGNIEYTTGTPADRADKISSLGVIVLNGNMFVAPGVEKLAGAYFIQRTDAKDYIKGNIISGTSKLPGQTSNVMLTVNGSIYGNIGPLFEKRVAAGDISKDQGAITIRYDQRIIQNPPAGLAELLGTFSQSQIAQ